MTTIYAVVGKTGAYEDRREWLVIAYLNEQAALAHAERAAARARELYCLAEEEEGWPDQDVWRLKNTHDPQMEVDSYTGETEYYVQAIELADG